MTITVARRQFVAALGGAAAMWPLVARAQQAAMPVIGYMNGGSASMTTSHAPFLQGLKESGFVEGQNVKIEYRWADGRYDHLPALAADLVNRKVDVIYASGGSFVTAAAKAATSTIPIVFQGGGVDPVKTGLVASLHRPGGNVTGVMNLGGLALGPKQIEFLRELVPSASSVGLLVNGRQTFDNSISIREAAQGLHWEFQVEYASTEADLETAFANLAQRRMGALVVIGDPFFSTQ